MAKKKILFSQMNNKFENELWNACDHLRSSISTEQYMSIVIGLLFLKYVSDVHDNVIDNLKQTNPDNYKELLLNRDFLRYECNLNIFVPEKAKWEYISQFATTDNIGEYIDNAISLIERENPELKGIVDKNYGNAEMDQVKLGNLVTEFSNIKIKLEGDDIFGRIYEYFLYQFFSETASKGGQFYTPATLVDLVVRLLKPTSGKLYDPACGMGGMFVQAKKYLNEHSFDYESLQIYGQEYQAKIWRLAHLNLLLNNYPNENINLGKTYGDTFTNDQFKGQKFDFVIANPPFNQDKFGIDSLQEDERWIYGIPNDGNFAWISVMLSHANNTKKGRGRVATVMPKIVLSASSEIKKNIIKANKLETVVSLPDKLFYKTSIPACILVFNNNKDDDRVLFIDATNFEGKLTNPKYREFLPEEISEIEQIHNKFLDGKDINIPDFAKSVKNDEIIKNDFSLIVGSYVEIAKKKQEDKNIIQKALLNDLKEFENLLEEEKNIEDQVMNVVSDIKKLN